MKKFIEAIVKSGALKTTQRTGWILKGITDAESVAEHSWRMCLLCLLLAPKELNQEKLLRMCVVHDLGEAGIGDIKWEAGKEVISSKEEKHQDELNVMKDMFGEVKDGQELVDLLKEYNEQKTAEAKFLKQIDKLEMIFQAYEYESEAANSKPLDEFWENVEKYLKGKELEPYFAALKKMRKEL